MHDILKLGVEVSTVCVAIHAQKVTRNSSGDEIANVNFFYTNSVK